MDWNGRRVRAILEAFLAEDKATHDVTTALTVKPGLRATATVVARGPCIVSGLGAIPVFFELFSKLTAAGSSAIGRFQVISHPEIFDGVRVKEGQTVAVIRHHAAPILSCERVILNLLQHMSGIATLTNAFVTAAAGTRAKVVDTRKTIPGLRALDKYAVCCGGGVNHRLDLQDGILIKANHIALGGGLPATLAHALAGRKPAQRVEVEVRTEQELAEALTGGADAILLVAMSAPAVKKAVKQIRAFREDIPIEAAANITLETVRSYAETGVDFLSVGTLTRSAPAAALEMRIAANVP